MGRRRHARPGAERGAAGEWRKSLVRLANRRKARSAAGAVYRRRNIGRAQETRRRDPATRLRIRALYTDRSMDADDGVSEKCQRHHTRPGLFDVERGKGVTPRVYALF